jgi:hypothetical protein
MLMQQWDATEWTEILRKLLDHQPIPYNIDFGEPLGHLRILEINAALQKYMVDNSRIVEAAYRLFHQFIRDPHRAQWAYALVELFDVIKPALYFDRLTSLLISSEYNRFFDAVPPVGEFHLRYRLINAIMVLDTGFVLLDHLLSKADKIQPPEYYQVMIRYLYASHRKSYLNQFMNNVFKLDLPHKSLLFLMRGFQECVYTPGDFEMLYTWISSDILHFHKQRRTLPANRLAFIHGLIIWIEADLKILSKYQNFVPTKAILSPYNKAGHFNLSNNLLSEILTYDKYRLKNKYELCEFIGNQNPRMHIAEIQRYSDGSAIIGFPNETAVLDIDLSNDDVRLALENFEQGIQNFQSYTRKASDWNDLVIGDNDIITSMQSYFK